MLIIITLFEMNANAFCTVVQNLNLSYTSLHKVTVESYCKFHKTKIKLISLLPVLGVIAFLAIMSFHTILVYSRNVTLQSSSRPVTYNAK